MRIMKILALGGDPDVSGRNNHECSDSGERNSVQHSDAESNLTTAPKGGVYSGDNLSTITKMESHNASDLRLPNLLIAQRPIDSDAAKTAYRDLESLNPSGKHLIVDVTRTKDGSLDFQVSGGTTADNAAFVRRMNALKADSPVWQHLQEVVDKEGKHRFELGHPQEQNIVPKAETVTTGPREVLRAPGKPTDTKSSPLGDTEAADSQTKRSPEQVIHDQLDQILPPGIRVTITERAGKPYVSWVGDVTPAHQRELQSAMARPEISEALAKVSKQHPNYSFTTDGGSTSVQSHSAKPEHKDGEAFILGADQSQFNLDADRSSSRRDAPDENFQWGGSGSLMVDGKDIDVTINPTSRRFENGGRIRGILNPGAAGSVSEVSGVLGRDERGMQTYYIDSYIKDGRVCQAAPGKFFSSIPLYRQTSNGTARY